MVGAAGVVVRVLVGVRGGRLHCLEQLVVGVLWTARDARFRRSPYFTVARAQILCGGNVAEKCRSCSFRMISAFLIYPVSL